MLSSCQQGFRVRFTTAASLVNELIETRDEKRLLRYQKRKAPEPESAPMLPFNPGWMQARLMKSLDVFGPLEVGSQARVARGAISALPVIS